MDCGEVKGSEVLDCWLLSSPKVLVLHIGQSWRYRILPACSRKDSPEQMILDGSRTIIKRQRRTLCGLSSICAILLRDDRPTAIQDHLFCLSFLEQAGKMRKRHDCPMWSTKTLAMKATSNLTLLKPFTSPQSIPSDIHHPVQRLQGFTSRLILG
jgi:hypothetical protein